MLQQKLVHISAFLWRYLSLAVLTLSKTREDAVVENYRLAIENDQLRAEIVALKRKLRRHQSVLDAHYEVWRREWLGSGGGRRINDNGRS